MAFEQVDRFNAELQSAGTWVFAGGLLPASSATVVRAEGDQIVVTDGPFTESKEHIGGFWVIEAPDLDAALAWAAKATRACMEPVEVRPFQENPGRLMRATRGRGARATIERVFREEYGRAVSVLVRAFGDIDLAEEGVQDAFTVAAARWPADRAPAQPGRVDHHHGTQPDHRPSAARGLPGGPPGPGRAAPSA